MAVSALLLLLLGFFVGARSSKVPSGLSSFAFSKVSGQGQALPTFRRSEFEPSVYLR